MTKAEAEKYDVIEQGLSEQLAEKLGNFFEGFCREHKCRVQSVVFYAPAVIGQPPVVSAVQFQCVTEERIAQMQREQNPKIITAPMPNGKLVN